MGYKAKLTREKDGPMRGRGGVCTSPKQATRGTWLEPVRDGMSKHRRFVWIKRGGVGRMSGNGPSGCKATPRALLSRTLRARPGVADAVTKRQAATMARKASPPKAIYYGT